MWYGVYVKIAMTFLLIGSARCLSNFLSKQQLGNKPFHRIICHKTLIAVSFEDFPTHLVQHL